MTDTLEKAIDWMDRALRETRETLAEVDPDKRDIVARNAAGFLAFEAAIVGATVQIGSARKQNRFAWHNVEVRSPHDDLFMFDDWVRYARMYAKAVKAASQ